MSDQFKVNVEVEEEVEANDKFGIEDKIADTLREMGYTVIEVKISW